MANSTTFRYAHCFWSCGCDDLKLISDEKVQVDELVEARSRTCGDSFSASYMTQVIFVFECCGPHEASVTTQQFPYSSPTAPCQLLDRKANLIATTAIRVGFDCLMTYQDTLNPFRRRKIILTFNSIAPNAHEFDQILQYCEAETWQLAPAGIQASRKLLELTNLLPKRQAASGAQEAFGNDACALRAVTVVSF